MNGDFEYFTKCPKGLNNEEKSKITPFVTNPNQGSFDFIHNCDDDKFPRFFWGSQEPYSGEGFAGVSVFINSTNQTDGVREYIQLELKDSLVKGSVYRFEMYLSLADKWNIAINNLGVYFSNEFLLLKTDGVIPVKPDIISPEFFSNKSDWDKYLGDYIAKGGEKYIIIGNFNEKKDVQIKIIDTGPTTDNYVYYFIDNVSLILNTNLSEGITLNNINFKTGSAELLTSSNIELNKIVAVLETNVKYKVEIIGHTDNVGNKIENIKLSKARANQVAKYLIEKGISAKRISSTGFGSKYPTGDNSTFEGRAKNRRVELKFNVTEN
ncbi:MAG: hypothetical protein A3K10_11620 [Bacteroidetes bacterium RIFCSPLOWO2_12_FULL_31_6]|nr:MAG: hypothetical protein A3K10_11620 [Bacteroidetes bacterium RIFCSPLOWO2_12_FULL_31_6]